MSFNLNEEVIDGHLVTAETKKLWAVEMDLAKKLLAVCERHNLKIYADGGTLLGAVRHQGFIPWDDDMDFIMPREDYNKLLEIGPVEFKEPYFFQSIYTDNTWGGMAKLRRSDTTMLDSNYDQMKERNYGIFIDIFVLDGIPADKKTFEKEYYLIEKKRRLLKRYGVYRSDYNGVRSTLRTLYVKLYFLIHDYKKEQKEIVDLLSSNSMDSCEYCTAIDFYANEHVNISKVNRRKCTWYKETIELPFVDMKLPAPKGYHELLSCQYGDYMTPVKGGQYHSIGIVDTEKSYKEVISSMSQKCN